MTTTTTQETENTSNPFFALDANGQRRADAIALARIVCCAHLPSDVWAGVRVHRALSGYSHPGLDAWLNGSLFAAWVNANDGSIEETDIPGLRELAYAYLDVHGWDDVN